MAVQYAVAHSHQVRGVGAVAAPGWGCADGRVATAVNSCMCDINGDATSMDLPNNWNGDPPEGSKLSRAFFFFSHADKTVMPESARQGAEFIKKVFKFTPLVQTHDKAKHGFLSPNGEDPCDTDDRRTPPRNATYVRNCEGVDNAASIFAHLYGSPSNEPTSRLEQEVGELIAFNQEPFIARAKYELDSHLRISPDELTAQGQSQVRERFDLAQYGYIYVPEQCKTGGSAYPCRVHVALHGCRQSALNFAETAGYKKQADRYGVIIVFPALEPRVSPADKLSICQKLEEQRKGAILCEFDEFLTCGRYDETLNLSLVEPNIGGCWDWWGYLDMDIDRHHYLTKEAPQMKVIELILKDVVRRPK